MKAYKRLIVIYTVFMLAVLAAIVSFCNGRELSSDHIASYDAQELKIYRQVWEQVRQGYEQSVSETLVFGCVVWGVVLLAGYLLLILLYFLLIKPAREMEGFAEEIAKGNLDISIPIYKENLFGSFTESFDLMREELKASKQREHEAEQAKREMVAELSHDLKTPVATIQATCEVMDLKLTMKLEKAERELSALLKSDETCQDTVCARLRAFNEEKRIDPKGEAGLSIKLSEEASRISENEIAQGRSERLRQVEENIREIQENLEKISYITNKAETIHQLVGNVFRATLEDMQEIKVEPKEHDSRLIEGYFKSLKEYGNILFENHVPECLVYMDKLRMEQVIDNVVGNSYKYAGTDVHVSFEETESQPNQDGSRSRFIKITIRDEGPGVPEEELPLLTQKFYRGKNTQEKQGYGLGLYLVNWYMEKQGGGMEYHNDHGFVVELLVKKV
jgi:signal transduction histidine kinase